MSFTISYTFLAKNAFSNVAKKIKNDMSAIAAKAAIAAKKMVVLTKKVRDFGRKAREMGTKFTAFATVPIVYGFKKMIDAASDAEETANKFKEVFKGIGAEGDASVGRLTDNFKLADSTAQELLANTGDLLVGLGLNRKEALKMSEAVVALSSDVASFKNVEGGAARAANSLTKALLGERESLKDTFKTAINEQEVKERAIQIASKIRGLTERQAKAMATLQLVTERNKDALGDFARTQDAYANVARTSSEQTKQMAESFGKLLLPIAVKIQRVIIKVVDWLNNLSPTMKTIILVVLAIIAVIGPLLLIVGFAISAFASLTVVAGTLGLTLGALAIPILLIVAAIGLLIAAVVLWYVRWDEICEGAKYLWNDLVNLVVKGAIMIANAIKDYILFPLKMVGKVAGFLGADSIANAIDTIDQRLTIGGKVNQNSKSQTDVNIMVRAQNGSIAEGASKTTGDKTANVGFNVIEAPAV